jgi:hypothetical protein
VKNLFKRLFGRQESKGIEMSDMVMIRQPSISGTQKEKVLKMIAEVKGVPVESLTLKTPLGNEHAHEICMNFVWNFNTIVVVNQGDTVGDLLKQMK